MSRKSWKEKIAESIVAIATDKAKKTVGKSWPAAVYEVEVPAELKAEYQREEA